jgi:hypothetical protein
MIELILIVVGLGCLALHPLQHTYGWGYRQNDNKWWGNIETCVSTTAYKNRDFECAVCLHSTYVTLILTLWFVHFYFGWSMFNTRGDCEEDDYSVRGKSHTETCD